MYEASTADGTVVRQGNVYFPFSNNLQFAILELMIRDEDFGYRCFCYLKEHYFKNEYLGWLFTFLKEHYEVYNKIPDVATIENAVLAFNITQRLGYERIIKSVLETRYADENYLRKELTNFIRAEEFKRSHNKGSDIFKSGDCEKAYNFAHQSLENILNIDFEMDDIVDFDNLDKFLQDAQKSRENRVSTGLHLMDEAMIGGLAPQTFTIFLAGTNSAKSIFLINLAYHAIVKQNKKVLFIVHENREEQWFFRFLSRFSEIPYNMFFGFQDQITEDGWRRVRSSVELIKKNLVIKKMYDFETCIEDVIAYTKMKKREFDFDLMINDYCQLLKTKRDNSEGRFVQAAVGRGLASIALKLDVAVATVAQSTRGAHQKAKSKGELTRMTDVSECFELIRVAENVITLTKSDEDEVNNLMAALLEKQRDGRIGVAVQMQTDLRRMATHGDNLQQWDLTGAQGCQQQAAPEPSN